MATIQNLFTLSTLKKYFGYKYKLTPVDKNLVDLISKPQKFKKNCFYKINDKFIGESVSSKIRRLIKIINKNKSDSIFISAPENVAWLLNIRGKDNPNSPIPNARIIIDKDKKIHFFCSLNKAEKIKKKINYKKIYFILLKNFTRHCQN